ncbi:MAG TPA: ATP-grasp fold amidoligase family protein [Frateuria sp.]|uniref:ATP-grasp fold amidoligase family protein n=1 Tax=Frateuria sp. TaxID=2211372 RepID=UPI002D7E7A76|nr:ATP-grasp fold amidoligase family protein [Frateuria sp.]HET6806878.1 ATP-grasp fold amidoligase family protein [Frateuria sp.]
MKKAIKRFFNSLPDPVFYQYKHLLLHRRFCNFRQPKRFSEKIFHRMRYPPAVFSTLADKVAARDYIAQAIGPQYLVPAFLATESVTPETIASLPSSFVMKSSNGFGQVKIVRDKSTEDPVALAELANDWLASRAASRSREKHYLPIPPRIIFEQPLLDGDEAPDDYKFNVFNSPGQEPFVFIQHMHGRFRDLEQQLYMEDWSPAPFKLELALLRESDHRSEKPEALAEMLALAKKLASPFGYLRVDFYVHQGRVYVGELTVTPGAGSYIFAPRTWERYLGDRFGWPENLPVDDPTPAPAPFGPPGLRTVPAGDCPAPRDGRAQPGARRPGALPDRITRS